MIGINSAGNSNSNSASNCNNEKAMDCHPNEPKEQITRTTYDNKDSANSAMEPGVADCAEMMGKQWDTVRPKLAGQRMNMNEMKGKGNTV